jgi:hypothetical protein
MEAFSPDQEDAVKLGSTDEDDKDNNKGRAILVGDLRMEAMNPDRLLRFFHFMGFHTMKQRFVQRLARLPGFQETVKAEAVTSSKPKGKYIPRRKMSIPKPEDYSDVPF